MSSFSPQILKTLTEQVQTLAPLRESFAKLERYYVNLTGDFEEVLRHSEVCESQLGANLRYLQEVHRSLQRELSCCGQQLRQAECEQARASMEKSQVAVQAEALRKRQLLDLEQKSSLENKQCALQEDAQRLSFTIAQFKGMVHDLQLAIKAKQFENREAERQLKKLEVVRDKIERLNFETEKSIEEVRQQSEQTAHCLAQAECRAETYARLLEAKARQNRQIAQDLIGKQQQVEHLASQKQFIEKVLQAQLAEQRELSRAAGQLQSALAVKEDKLALVRQQNLQFSELIAEERQAQSRHRAELQRLQHYLQTLTTANQHLYRHLEQSCSQDRDVQLMLTDKLQKLLVLNDKISEGELLRAVPQPLPAAQLRAKDWSRANASREMASTWGSHSKENRHPTDL